MTYEMIEKMLEEINKQITELNNKIVELTWIDKNFKKPEVKALEKRIEALFDKKHELLDLSIN